MNRNIKKDICFLLLIAPFLMPSFLLTFESINTFVKIWKICAGAWGIIWAIYRNRVSLYLVILSSFYGIIIYSGIIHGNFSIDWLMKLAFLWLVAFMTEEEEDREQFFKVYIGWNGILLLINLGTMIIYPSGMYKTTMYSLNWFLGYKNVFIRRIIPVLVVIMSRAHLREKNLSTFEKVIVICSLITTLLSKSIISMLGLAVFAVGIALFQSEGFRKIFSLGRLFLIYVVADIVFLSLNLEELLQTLLTELEKTGSALGRFGIWEDAIRAFRESPLIGYGEIVSTHFTVGFNVTHPHNLLLYYVLLGGVCCTLIFAFCLFWVDRRGRTNTDLRMNKVNGFFAASYLAFFSMAFGESLIGASMLIPFLIVMYNMNQSVPATI